MAADYYELLGVSRSASADEIKRAYRRLARELHPDANPDDPTAHDRFKEVSQAYETLSDPEKRQRYDMFGAAGPAGGGANPNDIFGGGLGDIFETFFGGGFGGAGGRSGPTRGADAEIVIDLGFEEAVFGAEKEIKLRLPVTCSTCDGSGSADGAPPANCTTCGGAGEVRRVRQSILGQMVTSSPCNACGGLGTIITSACVDCHGEGRRTEERVEVVTVPAGIDHGQTLRSTGRGAAAPRGGQPGDLYLHVRVANHESFERDGADLHLELHVPVTQAALGATREFSTLDGAESITLTPGTQSGTVLRLRAKGVPHPTGRGRGDLLIHIVVDTPTNLSSEAEALLRKLAEDRGETVQEHSSGLFSKIKSAFS